MPLGQTGPSERTAPPRLRDPAHPEWAAPSPGRSGALGFALLLGAAAALATLPDLVGLDAHSPFAQVIAFRPLMVAALGVLVVVGLLITLAARRFWPVPVVLALVALVGAAMVLPAPWRAPPPPAEPR